jgi:hypothetical protein
MIQISLMNTLQKVHSKGLADNVQSGSEKHSFL